MRRSTRASVQNSPNAAKSRDIGHDRPTTYERRNVALVRFQKTPLPVPPPTEVGLARFRPLENGSKSETSDLDWGRKPLNYDRARGENPLAAGGQRL